MNLVSQLSYGLTGYIKSLSFISKHKLWGWFVVPGIINLAIFLSLGVVAWEYSEIFSEYFINLFGIKNETGSTVIFWISLIISRIVLALMFFLVYRYLLLILISPALALFADKLFKIQTGIDIPFNSKLFVNNVFRGIGIAIKNLVKELFLTVLVTLLTFTGLLAPFVPVLIFTIQGYFYGFSMIDYRCELM